jgi:FMN phosphatase YigB (HAD superfamily)
VIAFNMQASGVVVDHPLYYTELLQRGAAPVPFFSPRVSPFYDRTLEWKQALSALRKNDIRLVIITKGSPMSEEFLKKFPFLDHLQRKKPNAIAHSLHIYDLMYLEMEASSSP